ncbi:putative membrane protein [Enterococcus rotai]|uniref:Uncharacterized protein n=1 Tax=Enterococcus rotai TaxID=118060 RepID=A0A0U2LV02_9ENTE|nr:hypothetical protein ATZ35_04625 [Enterococcus rotai]
MNNGYTTNPLVIAGVILFIIGLFIFIFGKKFILLRAYFGDRSMFSQILWGTVIMLVGFGLLFISNVFS